MERGVRIDEGQVLTLQACVLRRPCASSEFAQHRVSLCRDASGCVHESAGEGPAKGARLGTIPMPDEAQDVVSEPCHALEAAVAQDAALKDAEPDLDLVDPGSMQRGVDKAEAVPVLPVEPRPALWMMLLFVLISGVCLGSLNPCAIWTQLRSGIASKRAAQGGDFNSVARYHCGSVQRDSSLDACEISAPASF